MIRKEDLSLSCWRREKWQRKGKELQTEWNWMVARHACSRTKDNRFLQFQWYLIMRGIWEKDEKSLTATADCFPLFFSAFWYRSDWFGHEIFYLSDYLALVCSCGQTRSLLWEWSDCSCTISRPKTRTHAQTCFLSWICRFPFLPDLSLQILLRKGQIETFSADEKFYTVDQLNKKTKINPVDFFSVLY